MTYPKPLSENSLKKLYASIGVSEQAIKDISDFFDVCSQLYGCISLGNAWDIYKTLMQEQGVTRIHRKDLYRYAEIAKRDIKSYRIYDDTEIWTNGDGSESWKMLINNDYIGAAAGLRKFFSFYMLYEAQMNKSFYIPDDFLHYLERPMIEEEKQLLKYLECLKVTATEAKVGKKTFKCEHQGQYLKDFKFYNVDEKFEIKYFSGQIEGKDVRKTSDRMMLEYIEKKVCDNEALKIIRILRDSSDKGFKRGQVLNPFQDMFDELNEVGVQLTFNQLNQLIKLSQNFVNKFNHRTNRGWAPEEMPRSYDPTKPIHMTFGPGIKNAINSGELNKEELAQTLIKLGVIPEFD